MEINSINKKKKSVKLDQKSFFEFVNQEICKQSMNGYYIIPSVQRQFVWKSKLYETIINKLFKDAWNLKKGKNVKNTFLGYILLYNSTHKNIQQTRIIDGQQRLITFTLILCSLRHLLYDLNNKIKTSSVNIELNQLRDLYEKSIEFDQFFGKKVGNRTTKLVENVSTYESIKELVSFLLKWVEFFLLEKDSNKTSLIVNSKDKFWLENILHYDEASDSFSEEDNYKENMYIYIVFKKILDKIKKKFNYKLNWEEYPHRILKLIMYFMLSMGNIKFVVTRINETGVFDSEYSMFINLNARRQNLAPYDIIKGYMLAKMDECNIETVKINERGRNLDERIFNIMFAKFWEGKEEEIIKDIYYDIDDTYTSVNICWKWFIKDFQKLKKPYIEGKVGKNDFLTNFFVIFHAYYTSNFREKNIDKIIEDWVDRPHLRENSTTLSCMEQISLVLKENMGSGRKLWNWNSSFIVFDKEEENNLVRLFYVYIRTMSKTYFNKVFNIDNSWILQRLVETSFFKPEIMRIILSILDENLKLDKNRIKDASKALELLVWYYSMYYYRYTDKAPWVKRFVTLCKEENIKGINKYGFWQLDLKGYIKNLKNAIKNVSNKLSVFSILRGEKHADTKILTQMYPLFLSRYSRFVFGLSEKEEVKYQLRSFIPNTNNIVNRLNDQKGSFSLDLSKKPNQDNLYVSSNQIGNFFYLDRKVPKNFKINVKTDEISPSLEVLVSHFTHGINYKKEYSNATKEFINSMQELEESVGCGHITWQLISTRTDNIIKELDDWIEEICK